MRFHFMSAAAAAFAILATPAISQDIVLYRAYIGEKDLVNSEGKRLGEVWQVLRQDRANYHRFGIRQVGDEADPLFSNADQRAALEQLVKSAPIDKASRAAILKGGALVQVRVYGNPAKAEVLVLN